jgi:hypothetical protein
MYIDEKMACVDQLLVREFEDPDAKYPCNTILTAPRNATDEEVNALLKSCDTDEVLEFFLRQTGVTDSTISSYAGKFVGVHSVMLGDTHITDTTVITVVEYCARLLVLDVQNTQVTDLSATALLKCNELEMIVFIGTKVSPELAKGWTDGYGALQQAFGERSGGDVQRMSDYKWTVEQVKRAKKQAKKGKGKKGRRHGTCK